MIVVVPATYNDVRTLDYITAGSRGGLSVSCLSAIEVAAHRNRNSFSTESKPSQALLSRRGWVLRLREEGTEMGLVVEGVCRGGIEGGEDCDGSGGDG